MKDFIVEYFEDEEVTHYGALYFKCSANDSEHAREQCENAEPNAKISKVGVILWEK